jgi:hypothetical protein
MLTIHDGAGFRLDYNRARNSSFLVHKASGRSVYMDSERTWRFREAIIANPACAATDTDGCYEWVWVNAGFHRLAN